MATWEVLEDDGARGLGSSACGTGSNLPQPKTDVYVSGVSRWMAEATIYSKRCLHFSFFYLRFSQKHILFVLVITIPLHTPQSTRKFVPNSGHYVIGNATSAQLCSKCPKHLCLYWHEDPISDTLVRWLSWCLCAAANLLGSTGP